MKIFAIRDESSQKQKKFSVMKSQTKELDKYIVLGV